MIEFRQARCTGSLSSQDQFDCFKKDNGLSLTQSETAGDYPSKDFAGTTSK